MEGKMWKRVFKFAVAVSAVTYLGFPGAALDAHESPSAKATVPPGEFRITTSRAKGSVRVEARDAPVVPLLQAVARYTNCKIIMSDEAQEKLQGVVITYANFGRQKPLDVILRVFESSSLSWGEV